MEKVIYDEKNGLWYELQGDYYIPCLKLPEEQQPIGIWGQRHLRHIKENSKVLFVVDCSASMKEKASKSRNKNKLDVLRDELQAIVKQMNSDNQASGFAIVTFGSFSQRFPAVNLYSKNAILPALAARGETRMCKAWTLAVDVIKKEKIDTVYFLTDGNPSDRFRLRWLNNLLKRNEIDKLTIHCICLGKNRQMMREIAAAYNGQYKCIR